MPSLLNGARQSEGAAEGFCLADFPRKVQPRHSEGAAEGFCLADFPRKVRPRQSEGAAKEFCLADFPRKVRHEARTNQRAQVPPGKRSPVP